MSFSAFPDQKDNIALLQNSLARGRLGHAYLFDGHALGQLEAVATTLAKSLNCENPPARSEPLITASIRAAARIPWSPVMLSTP